MKVEYLTFMCLPVWHAMAQPVWVTRLTFLAWQVNDEPT
ncbi:hypothetical protein GGI1_13399 [Acidithiobacillus sp. GGI-221]|nr:hypothetical protein GGI1_13399 [Acidithiobacillus sp. GGI-221]